MVSGQLYSVTVLPPRQELPVPIGEEAVGCKTGLDSVKKRKVSGLVRNWTVIFQLSRL